MKRKVDGVSGEGEPLTNNPRFEDPLASLIDQVVIGSPTQLIGPFASIVANPIHPPSIRGSSVAVLLKKQKTVHNNNKFVDIVRASLTLFKNHQCFKIKNVKDYSSGL